MKTQELRHLNHSVYSLHAHLVLITKYRKKCINSELLKRLKEILSSVCNDWECELLEFNGEPDHVHLLISLNPKVQPSKLVNNLKTVSSRLIRRDFEKHLSKYFGKPVFWSRSYCLISAGGAPLEVIKQYIQSQDAPEWFHLCRHSPSRPSLAAMDGVLWRRLDRKDIYRTKCRRDIASGP